MKKRKKRKQAAQAPVTRGFFSSLSQKARWGLGLGAAAAVIVAVVVLCAVVNPSGVINNYRPPALTFELGTVSRTEAAIDEEKNEAFYQEQIRDVWYTYAGQKLLLTDANYDDRDDQGKFFKEFIDSIKAGDWESYRQFFAEGYFDQNETKENMTPQKLYDIEIEYNSQSKGITLAGKTYDVENFEVKYKILANDSSFRNDLPSDVWKPQIYQVAQTQSGYRIVNIINVISAE